MVKLLDFAAMRVTRSKTRWWVEGLLHSAANPRRRLVPHLAQIYGERALDRGRIPVISIGEFVGEARGASILLEDFIPVNMNVSVTEIAFISLLVRAQNPRVLLEIGTFDGNTTLQLAANSAPGAVIYTVDLPDSRSSQMHASGEKPRRFVPSQYAGKVLQKLADTMTADFAELCDGHRPDLVFIDAGHRYSNVKNDTEKTLAILAEGGLLIWHDYAYNCAGVFNYLNEFAATCPLYQLRDSSLVVGRPSAQKKKAP